MSDTERNERIEKALDMLRGDRDSLRASLEPEAILKRICERVEITARNLGLPVWAMISDLTGHGSGVSSAIHYLYGELDEQEATK